MDQCFKNLVGLKSLCSSGQEQPVMFLDDIEGITETQLANLATPLNDTGKKVADSILESAVRLMKADIDTLIPPSYQILQQQVAICSKCSFSNFSSLASALGSGIVIKDTSASQFSSIIINSLKIKVHSSGSYVLKIDDGIEVKTFTRDFVAGQELELNMSRAYKTRSKTVKVYFDNTAIALDQVICKSGGCGCGIPAAQNITQLKVVGMHAGVENTTQYGIIPCVTIGCDYDTVICNLINASPRIFAIALLYLSASKIFGEAAESKRVNRWTGRNNEEVKEEKTNYYDLYNDRLRGNPRKKILGITQAISNNLSLIKNDNCISCNTLLGTGWATG